MDHGAETIYMARAGGSDFPSCASNRRTAEGYPPTDEARYLGITAGKVVASCEGPPLDVPRSAVLRNAATTGSKIVTTVPRHP